MSDSRALLSFSAIIGDREFRSNHLKLCVLWYDEILFQTLRPGDERLFVSQLLKHVRGPKKKAIHNLTDVIVPLTQKVARDVIDDPLRARELGYPRWGKDYRNYTYPRPENAEQFAHNRLLQLIEAEHGVSHIDDGYAVQQVEGRARVAVDAVRLWARVNHELPCMLLPNHDEHAAMLAVEQFLAHADTPPTPFALFEASIPSLQRVPWDEIFRMRGDKNFNSLRNKLDQVVNVAGDDTDAAKHILRKLETGLAADVIEEARPRFGRRLIESVLSIIPFKWHANPFHFGFEGRNVAAEWHKRKKLGWFYLLRDIRHAARKK